METNDRIIHLNRHSVCWDESVSPAQRRWSVSADCWTSTWKPEVKLHRTELPQQHVCKEEEVPTDPQLCNQDRNSSPDQEDPEPPQIKHKEHYASQEGDEPALCTGYCRNTCRKKVERVLECSEHTCWTPGGAVGWSQCRTWRHSDADQQCGFAYRREMIRNSFGEEGGGGQKSITMIKAFILVLILT
ncbi:zinc finger protein OZF-like protein, partial [Lates japonicus]